MWPPPGHPAWRNKGVVGQVQRQGAPSDGSRWKKRTARNHTSDMKKAVLRTLHIVLVLYLRKTQANKRVDLASRLAIGQKHM